MTGDSNSKGGIQQPRTQGDLLRLASRAGSGRFRHEDDVIDGLCKEYQVIYVTQQYLHSNAVKALKKMDRGRRHPGRAMRRRVP